MPMSPYIKSLRQKVGTDLLLLPAVCGIVFNDKNEVLLGRRSDNGKWAAIAGVMEPGESPANAIVREVLEETGVTALPEKITGVYLSPIYTFPDRNRSQYLTVTFRCRHLSGTPHVADDESLEVRYFPLHEIPPLMSDHGDRVRHAAANGETFFAPTTQGAS